MKITPVRKLRKGPKTGSTTTPALRLTRALRKAASRSRVLRMAIREPKGSELETFLDHLEKVLEAFAKTVHRRYEHEVQGIPYRLIDVHSPITYPQETGPNAKRRLRNREEHPRHQGGPHQEVREL